MYSYKAQSRRRLGELRDLVNQWDPIGVMDSPDWPRDEYDDLVAMLMRLLVDGADTYRIAQKLEQVLRHSYKLSTIPDVNEMAALAQTWYLSREEV